MKRFKWAITLRIFLQIPRNITSGSWSYVSTGTLLRCMIQMSTTTIKCLLNLLRPTSGTVRVFGLDPRKAEVAVKSRIAYVPDYVAFYPWMTVRQTLDYFAAFRARWNRATESALLERFRLDPRQNTMHLSKGQRTQLALITAILLAASAVNG